ncbi:hypothetical protein RDI58_021893 [Solanum bulbocastanum]|uniref:Uncharacterized protein n=1 Tax=Solanum bulbocastanum TaxID=147425 RepID=A0AAN8Y559_SOLBU
MLLLIKNLVKPSRIMRVEVFEEAAEPQEPVVGGTFIDVGEELGEDLGRTSTSIGEDLGRTSASVGEDLGKTYSSVGEDLGGTSFAVVVASDIPVVGFDSESETKASENSKNVDLFDQ